MLQYCYLDMFCCQICNFIQVESKFSDGCDPNFCKPGGLGLGQVQMMIVHDFCLVFELGVCTLESVQFNFRFNMIVVYQESDKQSMYLLLCDLTMKYVRCAQPSTLNYELYQCEARSVLFMHFHIIHTVCSMVMLFFFFSRAHKT